MTFYYFYVIIEYYILYGGGYIITYKIFQYRIYPNKQQEEKMTQVLDICRQLYNTLLDERIKYYKETGKDLTQRDQQNTLKFKKLDNPIYKEVYTQVLYDVTFRLDKAYKNFFRRVKSKIKNAGFPRFKTEDRYNSFTYPQLGKKIIDNKYLWLSGIGNIKMKYSRLIEGELKQIVIKRKNNKWFANIMCKIDYINISTQCHNNIVGFDMGINHFIVTSDGEFIDMPRYYKNIQNKLSKEQRKLSKKQKGSNRHNKQKLIISKIHNKIENQRKDFHHKLSTKLSKEYNIIIVEDLDIKNMIKDSHKGLNKSIHDVAWYQFILFLTYKVENTGGKLIKVEPYNTSQMCSSCGVIVKKELKDRIHKCDCGLEIDRDLNAAINVLNKGLKLVNK